MEIKTIKNLSDRGVDLISINDQIAVKRRGTAEQINRILNFYQQAEYLHRPQLLEYGKETDASYLIEEFITGEHCNFSTHQEISMLIDALFPLYQLLKDKKNLKNFIHQEYVNKLQSLPSFDHQTLEILNTYALMFLQERKEGESIELHQIHGDLKPDNIIFNKHQATLIDRERNKVGHYLEDIQKLLNRAFHYKPSKVDSFLNLFLKEKNIVRKDFLYLESFFFFLNRILDLSKKRITLEQFIQKVEEKLNLQEKGYNRQNWWLFGKKNIYQS